MTPFASQRVWIVDDSPMEARASSAVLERDFACEVLASGATALERMAAGDVPDVLLLDWEMPDLSGVEICRFVRTTHDELTLPILLLTGRSDRADLLEGLDAGANDFITKPYHPAVLMARLRSAARLQALHRRGIEAEARHATTLRSIGDGVISTGATTHITFMNPVAEQLTGWAAAEALGRPLADVVRIVHETTRAAIESPVDHALRGDHATALADQLVLVRRDGSDLAIEDRAAPIRDTAGALIGVVLVLRDVTEQRLARHRVRAAAQALAQSEARLRRVVEVSGVGLWDLDPTTGVIEADARMVELMGLPEGSSFTLASGLATLSEADQARVAAAVSAALRGDDGGRYLIEFQTGGRDGAPMRWVESRAAVDLDPEGHARRLRGVMIDVTARKQAEEQTRNRAAFERQLIGIVSHDLRNPLSTILLGTQMLMAGDRIADSSLRALARIQAAAERCTRMVNDLLDFTQVRVGGGLAVAPAPGNMHALVRQAAEEVGMGAAERELQVVATGDAHGAWDLDRMSQVMHNLLTNALKYSPPDSAISVRCEAGEADVAVEIHNLGAPIAPEALARIFQPMQRATSQLENRARSVGLGLFIVKHIVEAHHGEIAVRSTADGTTFAFRVPKHPRPAGA